VILLNGAANVGSGELEELLGELRDTEHRLIELPRPALDLVAYRQALSMLDHELVCLLNSYSRLLADGWLAKLGSALEHPGIGLVGASGSWASHGSNARFHLGLPSPYRRVYRDRAATIAEFAAIERDRTGLEPSSGLLAKIGTTQAMLGTLRGFPPFPAVHLRTNAFMGRRELLAGLLPANLADKGGAHRVEGGRRSITRLVQDMGLDVRVVDRDGLAFAPADWPQSATFWQRDQEGLLVADNQTGKYEHGDAARRLLLSRLAWGERADIGAGVSR
jgi:hypothetical protein